MNNYSFLIFGSAQLDFNNSHSKWHPGQKKTEWRLKTTPTEKNQRQKYRTPSKNHYPDPKKHICMQLKEKAHP
jgi:hypothetical protein